MKNAGEFRFVNSMRLSATKQGEVFDKLFSIYGSRRENILDRGFYWHAHNGTTLCVLKGEKLVGAIHYFILKDHIYVAENWALPSKEFLKLNGKTIGRALHDVVEKVAKKKGVEVLGAPTRSGQRFSERINGLMSSKLRTPAQRKEMLTKSKLKTLPR